MFLLAPEELNYNKEGKIVPIIPVQLLMYQNMFINHIAPLFIALKIIDKRNGTISLSDFEKCYLRAIDVFSQEFVSVEINAFKVLKNLESLGIISWNRVASEVTIKSDEQSNVLKDVLFDISRTYFATLCLTLLSVQEYGKQLERQSRAYLSLSNLNSLVRNKITQCYDAGKLLGTCAVTTSGVNNVFNLCKIKGALYAKSIDATVVILVNMKKCLNLVDEVLNLFNCDEMLFAVTSVKSKL